MRPKFMNPLLSLPNEWRGTRCPGNGNGNCGALIIETRPIWVVPSSRWSIYRRCANGHSIQRLITEKDKEEHKIKVIRHKVRPAIDKIQPRKCTVCAKVFKPDYWFQRGCNPRHSEIHNHRHRIKRYFLRLGQSEDYAMSRARQKFPDNWSAEEAA